MKSNWGISEPEGLRLEYKSAQGGLPKDMYETVCAFLNREGGDFLVQRNQGNRFPGAHVDFLEDEVFTTTVWLDGAQSQNSTAEESQREIVLLALAHADLSLQELVDILGLKSKTGSLKRCMAGLLSDNAVEYTLPDKPNSRMQKYRLGAEARITSSSTPAHQQICPK